MIGFSGAEAAAALRELATDVAAAGDDPVVISVVGGAAIAIEHGPRVRSPDIDVSISVEGRSAQHVFDLAHALAVRRGWPDDWLNDEVANRFPPDGPRAWSTWHVEGPVTIRIADASMLLAMKLHAGRPGKDDQDIRMLLKLVNVRSVEEAQAHFERCWPGELLRDRTVAIIRGALRES